MVPNIHDHNTGYNSNAEARKKGNQPASQPANQPVSQQVAEENTNLTYHLQWSATKSLLGSHLNWQ